MENKYISFNELYHLVSDVLEVGGLSKAHAEAMANTIAMGEQDQCKSHGIYRVAGILKTLRAGLANGQAEPILQDYPNKPIFKINAQGGFSPLAFHQGIGLLVEKTKKYGIAAMAINDCVHFSALWAEVETLTTHHVAAIAMCPTNAYVAPAGGKEKLLGTNPFAFAWPRQGKHPYVFDFATAAVARGEVELHRLQNKPLPDGWGIDKHGQASNHAQEVLEGALLTFGGHKGSAISTMIEVLGGILIGDLLSVESSELDKGRLLLPRHGELIITFDPYAFGANNIDAHTEKLFSAFALQGARLPSQRRYVARAKSQEQGIPISSENMEKLCRMKKGDFSQELY